MNEPNMILISHGLYTLGVPESPSSVMHKWEKPRDVHMKDFLIAETSVTVGMFKPFLMEEYETIPPEFAHLFVQSDDLPANGLSWSDAVRFVRWIRKKTGKPYRLPTNDEWEAAARGGLVNRKFPWGDEDPSGRCDYAGARREAPLPVKSFEPNGYGLYDMAGNIWNWCSDLWINYTLHDPPVNAPTNLSTEINVILRGGSYMTADSNYLMCAYVHEDPPDLRHASIGMRLACDVKGC